MRLKTILTICAVASASVANAAAAHDIGTFPIEEAAKRGIDGCGSEYAKTADYRRDPQKIKAFVFVDDGDTGLIRVDGNLVEVNWTGAPADHAARFASQDTHIVVEIESHPTGKGGEELYYVSGTLRVTVDGKTQTIAVKGDTGC